MLRQQAEKESDDPYLSQADFIAPKVGGLVVIRFLDPVQSIASPHPVQWRNLTHATSIICLFVDAMHCLESLAPNERYPPPCFVL